MRKNKKWFSIIIVLWLVIMINIIAIWILDYVLPFSRDTKWIENSSKAYYQANSWIESILYEFKGKEAWYETWKTIVANIPVDYSYNSTSNWNKLPPAWKWNSEYRKNWNTISTWKPIQLQIWFGKLDFNSVDTRFSFRVPNLDNTGSTVETLSWSNTFPIINWQISTDNNTLNATWSYIYATEICWSDKIFGNCNIDFNSKQWVDLNDNQSSQEQIWNFYNTNCGVWSWCILKLSVVNKLELDIGNVIIPYLEWKIRTDWDIPLRYSIIEAEWKSYWYKKTLDIKVSQETTSEAFDFTVFQ
jgi:hypothetical protein